MILQVLHCPHCYGTDIVRHGLTRQGKQRYRCREKRCAGRTFLLDDSYPGQSPAVKEQIVEMALNASGIRDTARVLHVSTNTVMTELKKREGVSQVLICDPWTGCEFFVGQKLLAWVKAGGNSARRK